MDDKIQGVKLGVAAGGGFVAGWFGGFDNLIILLAMLIIFDFGLGLLKAFKTKTFDSSIVRWGAVNKALEFLIIIVFYHCDNVLHTDIFRNAAIIWFCVCEGGSILENTVVLGVPWPEGLKEVFAKVKDGCSVNFVKIVKRLIDEKGLEDKDKK